jgi:hypothetical protein
MQWVCKAADLGNAIAIREYGRSMAQDRLEAIPWHRRCAVMANQLAKDNGERTMSWGRQDTSTQLGKRRFLGRLSRVSFGWVCRHFYASVNRRVAIKSLSFEMVTRTVQRGDLWTRFHNGGRR